MAVKNGHLDLLRELHRYKRKKWIWGNLPDVRIRKRIHQYII